VTEEEEELSPIEEAYEAAGMEEEEVAEEEVAETVEKEEKRFLFQRAPTVRIRGGKNKIDITAGRGSIVTDKPTMLWHLRPGAMWVSMDREDALLTGRARTVCSVEETEEGIHIRCSHPREVAVL
jgi:hypothetical protein